MKWPFPWGFSLHSERIMEPHFGGESFLFCFSLGADDFFFILHKIYIEVAKRTELKYDACTHVYSIKISHFVNLELHAFTFFL